MLAGCMQLGACPALCYACCTAVCSAVLACEVFVWQCIGAGSSALTSPLLMLLLCVQVVLVSATLPNEVLQMTQQFMTDPIKILVKRDELTLEVGSLVQRHGSVGCSLCCCSWVSSEQAGTQHWPMIS